MKRFRNLCIITALAVVATACGGGDAGDTEANGSDADTGAVENDAEEPAATASDVTLRVAGWASSDIEDAALNAQLAQFTEQTGIEVVFEPSPDYDTTQQTAFASGQYANVFYVDSSKLPDWAAAGVVAPAEGSIEDPDGIYPALLDVFTVDGVLYCPPKDFATMGLQYNRDLFDAAGLDYPDENWTWDDLRDAAEVLTDEASGVIGLVTPADLPRWLAFMHQGGGRMFDDTGAFVFDSPEVLDALDYYASFARDGIGGPPSSVDAGWGGEAFGRGRTAMAMEGNWVISYLLETFPELNWGNTELPAGPGGKATMAFTVCFGVGANNDHPEESWQLVNFLTGEDTQQRLGEEGFGPMPGRISAADAYANAWEAAASGTGFDAAGVEGFIAGAAYGERWQLPVGWGAFTDEFNAGMERAFAGDLTAEALLAQLVAVGEELAD
jgi:multiple sugar transport system substrate-binding protein